MVEDKRPGKRYSALIEFKGEVRVVPDIRARDTAHAWQLLDRRRVSLFRHMQIPVFQQRSYRVLGLFFGTIKLAVREQEPA